jgi:hypothetical protein
MKQVKLLSVVFASVALFLSSCGPKDYICECTEGGVTERITYNTTKRTAKDVCVSTSREFGTAVVKEDCKLK